MVAEGFQRRFDIFPGAGPDLRIGRIYQVDDLEHSPFPVTQPPDNGRSLIHIYDGRFGRMIEQQLVVQFIQREFFIGDGYAVRIHSLYSCLLRATHYIKSRRMNHDI